MYFLKIIGKRFVKLLKQQQLFGQALHEHSLLAIEHQFTLKSIKKPYILVKTIYMSEDALRSDLE